MQTHSYLKTNLGITSLADLLIPAGIIPWILTQVLKMVRTSMSSLDFDLEFKRSFTQLFFTTTYILFIDTILYTCLIPLFATYISSSCAMLFSFISPNWEMVLVVGITFFLLYVAFSFFGESSYWKYLFAFDDFYASLLTVRDIMNSFTLLICLIGMASTVEQMINDRGLKTHNLSEGSGYVFMKNVLQWFSLEQEGLPMLGLKLPHKATLRDPNFGENERFEHAGAYMLFWAMLTACFAKVLYLNTLFTFLRAMNIFISLKPSFDDDESDEQE